MKLKQNRVTARKVAGKIRSQARFPSGTLRGQNPQLVSGSCTLAWCSTGRAGGDCRGLDRRREEQPVVDLGERQLDPEGLQHKPCFEAFDLLEAPAVPSAGVRLDAGPILGDQDAVAEARQTLIVYAAWRTGPRARSPAKGKPSLPPAIMTRRPPTSS